MAAPRARRIGGRPADPRRLRSGTCCARTSAVGCISPPVVRVHGIPIHSHLRMPAAGACRRFARAPPTDAAIAAHRPTAAMLLQICVRPNARRAACWVLLSRWHGDGTCITSTGTSAGSCCVGAQGPPRHAAPCPMGVRARARRGPPHHAASPPPCLLLLLASLLSLQRKMYPPLTPAGNRCPSADEAASTSSTRRCSAKRHPHGRRRRPSLPCSPASAAHRHAVRCFELAPLLQKISQSQRRRARASTSSSASHSDSDGCTSGKMHAARCAAGTPLPPRHMAMRPALRVHGSRANASLRGCEATPCRGAAAYLLLAAGAGAARAREGRTRSGTRLRLAPRPGVAASRLPSDGARSRPTRRRAPLPLPHHSSKPRQAAWGVAERGGTGACARRLGRRGGDVCASQPRAPRGEEADPWGRSLGRSDSREKSCPDASLARETDGPHISH
ncbi:hypothetical protein FA09DRAFT_347228 [Tilletiopsis washingtonensis]|uniref:Uncharacterized protein n=1 Tax=Tilletiopsis washingtonensis TaxID=58919 RepID=A0A316Z2Q1_9BASI|nr:hypothetical protein FA09DRAFT_347228 [Tilletiopsis washingtonensis]PWN95238.1 hypothetical protein FA09DRAFT_347228 [Tilletiopsis washingtonensis]